ncbi:MAG: GntR family transcriptional regulator [Ruminococcaceae bacterium]|nr:GntR family transcriptional regulator [Oscillospiraceae bacterium]
MAEFKIVSLASQVFDKLEEDILTGVYARGEILTELKLVEQLGVSRTPIREALRRLEQERLIAECGKGSIVLGITPEDLRDIMDVRYQLEGAATYYATQNATEEDLANLRRITDLQEFYFTKQDSEKLRQMDDQFHETIYTLSRRPVLQDILASMHRKSQRYRRISMEVGNRLPLVVEEHRGIYEAMAQRNGELAAERMNNHIAAARKNMMERCGENG